MKKHLLLITIIAMLFLLAGSVTAWGTSSSVVAVDDQASCSAGQACSSTMGSVIFSHYPDFSFTRVAAGSLDASTIGSADTVFLYAVDPDNIPAQGKMDLVNFVATGGKLIIWDGEDACGSTTCSKQNPGTVDYSWLPAAFQFVSYAPGPYGASGSAYPLTIKEDSQLSPTVPVAPFVAIDTTAIEDTDAVGDANIFTSYIGSHWCVNMEAVSVIESTGPVHLYTKDFGDGILIYAGFDYDEAWTSGDGLQIENILRNELFANDLPCFVPPTDLLKVEKTTDKPIYNVGDPIVFTITIENLGSTTSYRTTGVDTPPAGVTCPPNPIAVGDIAPGIPTTVTLNCEAIQETCAPVKNLVLVTGYSDPQGGVVLFTGSDEVEFTIDGPKCGPVNAPEFPTLALPIGMIIGIVFVIYSVKRKD